jgi:alpha-glucosidase
MKRAFFLLLVITHATFLSAQKFELTSPDTGIKLIVNINENISFSVLFKDEVIIENSSIDLSLEGLPALGKSAKVKKVIESQSNSILTPVIHQKSSTIRDVYNELSIFFLANYELTFRVYDDGVAYRFSTSLKKDVIVSNESLNLRFSGSTACFFPEESSMISHYERLYKHIKLDTLKESVFCSLPVLMNVNDVHVLVTESDVYDYPCMFMHGTNMNGLDAVFPNYVTEAKPMSGFEDRKQVLTSAGYIAKTSGIRDYPWRVIVITNDDRQLVESTLVYQLASPLKISDTDWILPGKVAWDWYNANNICGVDFPAGINTDTYKYYIDFASEYGLEYVILDEGWSKATTQIQECNPDINVKELVEYGKEKNVGIILWTLWGPLDNDLSTLELYESWGVKGIKVDFMQRADQYMVNFYERVATEAAKRHLLVDFHGSFKPSGLRRAYPNVLTYEGVKGNENNKWSHDITPEHNVTLPFIRMVAGPMDFTPGAMINATADNHRISFNRPMSLGTRCHQVAMYVVYESPLQMLCESPSTYYKEETTTKFISKIPTVWDEAIVLDAKVADYILIARRKDDIWYLGAMTDWTPRELEIDFSFLEEGKYTMEMMSDGFNTDRFAQDYRYETMEIDNVSSKKIKLASGGGWAAIITKR